MGIQEIVVLAAAPFRDHLDDLRAPALKGNLHLEHVAAATGEVGKRPGGVS